MGYNVKQLELLSVIKSVGKKFILGYGGSRSGKTWLFCNVVVMRALLYAGSRHLICRFNRNRLLDAIWNDTMPKVLRARGLSEDMLKMNKSELSIRFPNGSEIVMRGLDTEERVEAVLGTEYGTIYVNEASEIKSYKVIEKLRTRLNDVSVSCVDGGMIVPKMFFDCNPPSKTHWVYKLFKLLQNPDSGVPLSEKGSYGDVQLNPMDNVENLGEGYIRDVFSDMGEMQRRRFYDGEFLDLEVGRVFCEEWFRYYSGKPKIKYVVQSWDTAYSDKEYNDPSVGLTWGIGEKGGYYLLDCVRLRLTYPELRSLIMSTREKWGADWVLIENKSSGQSLLQELPELDQRGGYIPINLGGFKGASGSADNSKVARAAVSAIDFEAGMVYFPKEASWLEGYRNELLAFDKDADERDRVDATSQFLNWARKSDFGLEEEGEGEDKKRVAEIASVGYSDWRQGSYGWKQ